MDLRCEMLEGACTRVKYFMEFWINTKICHILVINLFSGFTLTTEKIIWNKNVLKKSI